MGRNARRTHNLKNKRGARRDEGGGGARRWPLGEREREKAGWRRKRGKSLPGFSVGLHEFAGGREGVKRGIYPAPRGGVKRARGWAGAGSGCVPARREGGCTAP